ncbi:dihydropteroate synthase [Marinactinospora thermotolerans DSM 45154]|uniref:Dihydropteroate synthase n=1 Tax=Marinactinospora thermotolerans DSM 45154 TaxID=1122192 RepID=A0A1T4KCX9_9ACTN|nr:dihydropteroate synthase [Marinactinospora thermotolerans]SJZ40236.1 dihydropteroate synthase [Marinactinospora thermotolerans DSM 45154]
MGEDGSAATAAPKPTGTLRLGRRTFPPGAHAVMAVVNRTPDSFYDRGATFAFDAALKAVDAAVEQGADIIDVGGVKAGYGDPVPPEEEIRRTVPFVTELRRRHPDVVISVDTWRAEVGEQCARAGADLINDTWAGADPDLARVAAEFGTGLVCSHSGGLAPRTDPHRVAYADVVADVVATVTGLAERAVTLGVHPDRILIDPTHDFGKNTYHSLELTRRLGELVATGWPVLVAVSNKDFIGETLDAPVSDRLSGTLAVLAVSAWQGARVFRVHDAAAARAALDTVARLGPTMADRPPALEGAARADGGR